MTRIMLVSADSPVKLCVLSGEISAQILPDCSLKLYVFSGYALQNDNLKFF